MSNINGGSLSGGSGVRKRKGKAPAQPATPRFKPNEPVYVTKLFGVPLTPLFTGHQQYPGSAFRTPTPFEQWNPHREIRQILEPNNEQLESSLAGVLDRLVQERAAEIIKLKEMEIKMKSARIKMLKSSLKDLKVPVEKLRYRDLLWGKSVTALEKKVELAKKQRNNRSSEHDDAASSNHGGI